MQSFVVGQGSIAGGAAIGAGDLGNVLGVVAVIIQAIFCFGLSGLHRIEAVSKIVGRNAVSAGTPCCASGIGGGVVVGCHCGSGVRG